MVRGPGGGGVGLPCHGAELRVRERLERREAVHPSGDGLDDTSVAHGVEGLPVHAEAQSFSHAEAAAMLAK